MIENKNSSILEPLVRAWHPSPCAGDIFERFYDPIAADAQTAITCSDADDQSYFSRSDFKAFVQELTEHYRVKRIVGFRNGFKGLAKDSRNSVTELTLDAVRDINNDGGTILGSSRGSQDPDEMVDSLLIHDVDVLFVIGGDGSMRGAMALVERIDQRDLDIAVVGVPKTIDNDLSATDYTFGFDTAVFICTEAIDRLHTTAESHNRVMVVVSQASGLFTVAISVLCQRR